MNANDIKRLVDFLLGLVDEGTLDHDDARAVLRVATLLLDVAAPQA